MCKESVEIKEKVKTEYEVKGVCYTTEEYRFVHGKLMTQFGLSYKIGDAGSIGMFSIDEYTLEDLKAVVQNSVLIDDCIIKILSKNFIDMKIDLKDNEGFNRKYKEISMTIVLTMIWLKGQTDDVIYKFLRPLYKNIISINDQWAFVKFFDVLELLDKVDMFYPPMQNITA